MRNYHPEVVGSSGGVVSGFLTLTGGLLTLTTAGAALPILAAGVGLGVTSGLTGVGAALSKRILESQQMKKCQLAIEADSESTEKLSLMVESVKKNLKTEIKHDVGNLGCEVLRAKKVVSLLGKNSEGAANMLMKMGGRFASKATVVVAGATIVWDLYSLATDIKDLVKGEGSQASKQIRNIAEQLERELDTLSSQYDSEFDSSQYDSESDSSLIGFH